MAAPVAGVSQGVSTGPLGRQEGNRSSRGHLLGTWYTSLDLLIFSHLSNCHLCIVGPGQEAKEGG